jgi:hypothetical protein
MWGWKGWNSFYKGRRVTSLHPRWKLVFSFCDRLVVCAARYQLQVCASCSVSLVSMRDKQCICEEW